MKLSQLKNLIKDLPDDIEVVISGPNCSYRKIISCFIQDAELFEKKLYEYYDKHGKHIEESEVVQVLLME